MRSDQHLLVNLSGRGDKDIGTVADLSNDIRPVSVSLAHVAARQELRNLMQSLGLDDALAPLDAAA